MGDGSNSQDRWNPVYVVYTAHIYARHLDVETMETADAV